MLRGKTLKFDVPRARACAGNRGPRSRARARSPSGLPPLVPTPGEIRRPTPSVLPTGVFTSIPGSVQSPGAQLPQATPMPVPPSTAPPYTSSRLNGGQPTPFPQQTLGPLTGETSLPYPAYGSPVPGVNAGTPIPEVPATITLPQAILVAFARSPVLEVARQDVLVQAASVRLERAGLLPSIEGAAAINRDHEQGGKRAESRPRRPARPARPARPGPPARRRRAYRPAGPITGYDASFTGSLRQLIYDGGTRRGIRRRRSQFRSVFGRYVPARYANRCVQRGNRLLQLSRGRTHHAGRSRARPRR